MPKKVLIVDDEPSIVVSLQFLMNQCGFEVITATSGEEALETIMKFNPNLILLDVMLPGIDGYEVCEIVRLDPKWRGIKIIFLSAKGKEEDIAKGMVLGADDYITKPTSMAVIRARVRAALRRAKQHPVAEPVLNFDDGALVIDQQRAEVLINGQPVILTPTEFRLLVYLISNSGKAVPHSEVLAAVWGPGYNDPEVLKIFVFRLRNKIEVDSSHPRYIKIKRGHGYYFNAQY